MPHTEPLDGVGRTASSRPYPVGALHAGLWLSGIHPVRVDIAAGLAPEVVASSVFVLGDAVLFLLVVLVGGLKAGGPARSAALVGAGRATLGVLPGALFARAAPALGVGLAVLDLSS